jgi:hypothetical protein
LVGPCKAGVFKQFEVKIQAPEEGGFYDYSFRLGSESIGLFGDTYDLRVIVEQNFFEMLSD